MKGHPNIIEAFNYYSDTGQVTLPQGASIAPILERQNCMSLEFCSHGDLIGLLIEQGHFQDEKLVKHLMLQICNGLEAVHTTANYAHLDIKPDNILIGDDYQLKLTDFGFAEPTSLEISRRCGTESYCAPEIHEGSKAYHGIQADIFSLGVVFFIMQFTKPPFSKASTQDNNYRCFAKNPSVFWRCSPAVRSFKKTGTYD